jgi:periplasmic protein TonB
MVMPSRFVLCVGASWAAHGILVAALWVRLAAIPGVPGLVIDLIAPPSPAPVGHAASAISPDGSPRTASAPPPRAVSPPAPRVATTSARVDRPVSPAAPPPLEAQPAHPRAPDASPASTEIVESHESRVPTEQTAADRASTAQDETIATTPLPPHLPAAGSASASPRFPSPGATASTSSTAAAPQTPPAAPTAAGRTTGVADASRTGREATGPLTPPRQLQRAVARYPESARLAGVQGTTVIRVRVARDGGVADAVIERSSGHEELDAAAMEAAKRLRFEPARRGGEPVDMWFLLPVHFSLG